MKDHVQIGHLTKYDAFRVNRDQIHTNVSDQRPPKPYKLLKFSLSFIATVKSR